MKLELRIETAGYCTARERFVRGGGGNKELRMFASFAVIRHPEKGIILFDTGYTRRFYAATAQFPGMIYAMVTPVYIDERDEAISILNRLGIASDDVNHIIISHFHADHIGGLRDFKNAVFHCSEEALVFVKNRKGLRAVSKGHLPSLLPDNFQNRVHAIGFEKCDYVDPHLGPMHDLFGDRSTLVCQLPGHARGQIGILINNETRPAFLAADACWIADAFRSRSLPSRIVRLFFDSWKDYLLTIDRIRAFHLSNPEYLIVPAHCEDSLSEAKTTYNNGF